MKKKKKISISKILESFLFCILGILMGIVAVIVACAINPDISKIVNTVLTSENANAAPSEVPDNIAQSGDTKTIIDENEVAKSESAKDPETPDISEEDGVTTDSSEDEAVTADAGSSASTEETTVKDTENADAPEESTGTNSTIENTSENDSDTNVISTSAAPSDDTPSIFRGKNSYVTADPEIINIDNENQANQIKNATGYGETGEGLDFDAEYYPYYNMLTDNQKAIYRQVYANAMKYNSAFKPAIETNNNDVDNAISCVTYDHPELFWLDTTFYTEYDYNGSVIKIVLRFYDQIGDFASARNEFENECNYIIQGAQGLGSDYDKEKYIHDYLADKLFYKHNPLDQSAYSSINRDYTVCAGYAKAFQYLMQKLGIPTYFCVGYGGNELHAWNIVKLDGEYYNVDCTWDDQSSTIYDYFNVSDGNNTMHTRLFQSVNLPACNGSKYSHLETSYSDYYNASVDEQLQEILDTIDESVSQVVIDLGNQQ